MTRSNLKSLSRVIAHSIVNTLLAYSATLKSVKPRSSIFLTMCIYCQQSVRPREEGLQCDGCLRRQHRTCNTGVSQSEYRDAVRTGASIDWRCLTCDIPLAESTALSEISVSVDPDVHFNCVRIAIKVTIFCPILLN